MLKSPCQDIEEYVVADESLRAKPPRTRRQNRTRVQLDKLTPDPTPPKSALNGSNFFDFEICLHLRMLRLAWTRSWDQELYRRCLGYILTKSPSTADGWVEIDLDSVDGSTGFASNTKDPHSPMRGTTKQDLAQKHHFRSVDDSR